MLTHQLKSLPLRPGVYFFKDSQERVLYVGKAKKLRNRVKSYFSFPSSSDNKPMPASDLDEAKRQMITKVASIDTVVCDTEYEALVLEANLIRQHRPPYNIVLTDDKSYLFIKITNEEWPRVFPVRRVTKDGARYFGPYSSARAVRHTLKLLQRLFPHLTDKDQKHEWVFPHPLFNNNEEQQPIKQNNKPLTSVDHEQYRVNIENIIHFLAGERDRIINTLKEGMQKAAADHFYERAAIFRDQLQALERLEGSQKVFMPRSKSFDIISTATNRTRSAANVFQIRHGKLIGKQTFLLKHPGATDQTDIVRQFVLQYYRDAQDIPPLILTPSPLTEAVTIGRWINKEHPPTFAVPQRGNKRHLLKMGELNATQALSTETLSLTQDQRMQSATIALAKAIGINKRLLSRIETYDISNIQGQLATGSMIVFINGNPSPRHYRKFRIKQQATPNDYAMLAEVLERRLSHTGTGWDKPDLIIVDGGKGQLNKAQAILNRLQTNIPLAALAKREELIFIPNRPEPVRLPYDSDALYLIQRMRDEAHRFTIQYHRQLRSRRSSHSLLDEIPGIGPKTRKILLRRFGSVKAIRAASLPELQSVVGSKASTIKDYL